MKKVYILLAQGFETIEALTPIDVMTRCKINVVTISIDGDRKVKSSHGVKVEADTTLDECDARDADVLILPGGYPGYVNLCENTKVGELAHFYSETDGKYLAAICGAPTVLQTYGVAKGSNITCHSSVADQMTDFTNVGGNVVVDGNLITGAGAGLALEFSIEIAKLFADAPTINHLLKGLQLI